MSERLTPDTKGITRAAQLLSEGQLVAFPTETVYGLGGDARDGQAVARIYEAKGRPSFNPLIVHVPDIEAAQSYAIWSDEAARLAQAFWPGPLTLVLPLRAGHGLSALVTAGLETVALRVPASRLAQQLLQVCGCPLAAPSANPSGRISPTTADHVLAGLDGRIAGVLDGGACPVGLESTIVAPGAPPRLLRAGGLASEEIERALGQPLQERADLSGAITAPGQLSSHYAPQAQLRLNAEHWQDGELRLGFGSMACDLNLSQSGDLTEAAANLFGHLHRLDAMDSRRIAVAPVPEHGLGRAINDRLRRAAAPRQ